MEVPLSTPLLLASLSLLALMCDQPFLLVKSDEALIQNLCNKTSEPSVCKDCLHRDPNSPSADIKGLALMSINCSEYDMDILYNYTIDLYNKTPSSQVELERILMQCYVKTAIARANMNGARRGVMDGSIDFAKNAVTNDVLPFINACLDEFNKSPTIPVPGFILSGRSFVTQDCQVILGILDNLGGRW